MTEFSFQRAAGPVGKVPKIRRAVQASHALAPGRVPFLQHMQAIGVPIRQERHHDSVDWCLRDVG